jgi:hypothetical protein
VSKSSTAGGAPAKRSSPQRRRPVTLVFRPAQDKSELSIKALIDGRLARLIAARIAMKVLSSHNQAADDGSRSAANHVTARRNKL